MQLSDVIATWLVDQKLPYEVRNDLIGCARLRRKGKLYNAEHAAIAHIYDKYVMLWDPSPVVYPQYKSSRLEAFDNDFFIILADHIKLHEARYKIMEKEAREVTYRKWVRNVRNPSWTERFTRAAKNLLSRFLSCL